jgi:hypothetical protein
MARAAINNENDNSRKGDFENPALCHTDLIASCARRFQALPHCLC